MLAEIYISALLVDEELADQVWEAWHSDDIDDAGAVLAWSCIFHSPPTSMRKLNRVLD